MEGRECVTEFIGEVSNESISRVIDISRSLDLSYSKITLNINSPGGDVIAAVALYNFLKSLPQEIHTHNLGEVSSAAILVFLAGKVRTGEAISRVLFHPITLNFNEPVSYCRAGEILLTFDNLIDNYAKIVEREAPNFCNTNNIYSLLKSECLFLSCVDCMHFGIYNS